MTVRWNPGCALWMTFGLALALAAAAPTHAADEMVAVNPQTLKFIPIPSMPSCATGGIVRGNPRWGAASVLLKLSSGCQVPWHWHTANEDMLVVSGQGMIEMQDGQPLKFAPGAYASLPSHHVHRASCSRTCLLFSIADAAFDINYVDDSGRAISAEQALQPPARAKSKPKSKKK